MHSDKDHQMPFVGGPHTRMPSWKKSKNSYIAAAVSPILTKFGMMMQIVPFDRTVC